MDVPAIFNWNELDNKRYSGSGTVRDMSVEGIFILSSFSPPIGARVDIEIAKAERPGNVKNLIRARMKVLRIDRGITDGGITGFAAHGRVFVGRSGRMKKTPREALDPLHRKMRN
jgi:hypothetical protein